MPDTLPFAGEGTDRLILRAAMARFSSYGYKRTSMEDIANQAMVARPTLYSYFKNKKAILRAVSEGLHNAVLANISTALDADGPLETRLVQAFSAWSEPFRGIMFGSPHGSELLGSSSALAADISAQAAQGFHERIAAALSQAAERGEIDLSRANLNLSAAAEFLILSLNGLSAGAADGETYRQRLQTLVLVFLTTVAAKPTGPTK